ncbi:MAG: hypothetical protein KUG75_10245 [Pseudomonadales bacterium]|nr:hypothetical protein [Pseudomonadales bacterium]
MNYVYAWLVVTVAGLGTLAGIFVMSRAISWEWLRTLVRCLSTVILLLPAGIQVEEDFYAPAFIVVLFEGLLKKDGNPGPAMEILGLGCAFVVVVLLLAQVWQWVRSRRLTVK